MNGLAQGREPPDRRGRRPEIVDDREREISVWIAERVARSHSTTSTEFREHVPTDSDFPVSRGCVKSLIGRHSSALSGIKSSPGKGE
jgi:hypothetical protein